MQRPTDNAWLAVACHLPCSEAERRRFHLQEFSFPDAVRLWDTLFSDPAGRTDCLLRICAAMLINVRTELLQVLS